LNPEVLVLFHIFTTLAYSWYRFLNELDLLPNELFELGNLIRSRYYHLPCY